MSTESVPHHPHTRRVLGAASEASAALRHVHSERARTAAEMAEVRAALQADAEQKGQ